MAIATDKPLPTGRNFAAWSAVGTLIYIATLGAVIALMGQNVMDLFKPGKAAALLGLGLCLMLSVAVVGYTGRSRPLTPRAFGNFMIQNAVAILLFLLALWGFQSFGGAMGRWEKAAAGVGLGLIAIAFFGSLATASTRAGLSVIDDEDAAEDMRERGRLFFYSFLWIAFCGVLLIGLSLAGPGGMLSPQAALAGALVLVLVLTVLGIVTWRLSDELGRVLSHETGNMAFYLILVLGGGWAAFAHLGYAAAPAPIGWLTMFVVLLFVASFIVLGRRQLLTR